MERRLRSRLKPSTDSWRVDSDVHPGESQVGVFYTGLWIRAVRPGFQQF
jgi:hypothetical protein